MTVSLDPKQLDQLVTMFERMVMVITEITTELKRANDREDKK
jgi:hypothetical protein